MTASKLSFVGRVILGLTEEGIDTRIRVGTRAQATLILRAWGDGCFGCLGYRKILLEFTRDSNPSASPICVQLIEKRGNKWFVSGPAQAALAANERGEDPASAVVKYWARGVQAADVG